MLGKQKLRTAASFQNRTAAIQDVGRTNTIKHLEMPVKHSRVPTDDADRFDTALLGRPLDRSNVGIHSGGIAPTGKYGYAFHWARK